MKAWVGGSHACAWLPSSFCSGLITFVSFSGSGHCCCSPLLIAFSFLVETVCMCLRSHWSQVGFQGGPSASRNIPLPIPLVVQTGSFSSCIPSPSEYGVACVSSPVSKDPLPCAHPQLCRIFLTPGGKCRSSTSSDWRGREESSLNCPIGGGVFCLPPSELAVSKPLWSGFPPFPEWLPDSRR